METRKDEKKSKFRIEALEERIAPKITTVTTNPAGNTTSNNAQGTSLTKTNVNPAGSAPPGQN